MAWWIRFSHWGLKFHFHIYHEYKNIFNKLSVFLPNYMTYNTVIHVKEVVEYHSKYQIYHLEFSWRKWQRTEFKFVIMYHTWELIFWLNARHYVFLFYDLCFSQKSEHRKKICSMKDLNLKHSCSKSEERLTNMCTELMMVPWAQKTSSTSRIRKLRNSTESKIKG